MDDSRKGSASTTEDGAPTGDDLSVGRVLLIGSSGGHLAQLLPLRAIFPAAQRTWVTFDTTDAVGALAHEHDVVWAHHPTTRNIPNLIRNTFQAWSVMRSRRPEVVVTTGAGVALPYFILSRLFGARTVYIEVYDRIDSPTLTARLCSPFTDLMAVQWDEQRSLYRDTVVIGPPAVIAWTAGKRSILVITGTDVHPFTRLCEWADEWALAHPDDDIVVQHGSAAAPAHARGVALLTPDDLDELLAGADVVVSHGGPGTISTVRAAGVQPIVLARNPAHGEHVDAHQMRFAAWAGPKGLGTVVEHIDDLPEALETAAAASRQSTGPATQIQSSLEALRLQIGGVVSAAHDVRSSGCSAGVAGTL